ncbi:hypothetical protein [Granulicella tundricola]|uniref:Uncharacterized protein n=1 Tax=Granulicella tundricola (strain ATCC BAA-1859 / DSM 23138 / MP5ACTX9) TaxID=1198114 RepID=E8X7M2_GRATM|nr:hypothetical protein [Granulicella tundricola]ADW71456.1 hypothetical protein AciX9_4515 [Granulicella tundricola MP5ACTX9]
MGGERASKTRQREAGKICCICSLTLDAPPWGTYGERRCGKCAAKQPKRRVLMNFMLRQGWHISFLEEDCQTSLRKKHTFADDSKVLEMEVKGDARFDSEGRMMFERGISQGAAGYG